MITIQNDLELPCGALIKNRLCKGAMTEGLADEKNRATSNPVSYTHLTLPTNHTV